MVVITRWSYKRGGRKPGFHCSGEWRKEEQRGDWEERALRDAALVGE